MESLQARIENVEAVLRKVTWGDRDRPIRSWRRQKKERAQQGIGDLARHFRSADQTQLTVLKKSNGEITGSIHEMDLLLSNSWLPIFAKHTVTEQAIPDTEAFMERYSDFITYHENNIGGITLEKVKWAIGRLATNGAGGLDGWKPKDLKELPDVILQFLNDVYEKIEETGIWSTSLCTAGILLIPKGEGGAPLDQRPITVSAIVYRRWAAVRMRDSIPWQEAWMRSGQHGARAHHSTVDSLMRVSLFFEQSILDGTDAFEVCTHKSTEDFASENMSEKLSKTPTGYFKVARCL